jgi:histidyl-tRNA synthetase
VQRGFTTAERLRDRAPDLKVSMAPPSAGFKAQLRRADKSGARFALIVGEDELAADKVSLKNLRTDEAQRLLTFDELVQALEN